MQNGLTNTEGIYIGIQESIAAPKVNNGLIPIAPGTATSIGIAQKEIRRLPYPYKSNCVFNNSMGQCQSNCVKLYIQQHCNCTFPMVITGQMDFLDPKANSRFKFCDIDDDRDSACIYDLFKNGADGLCQHCQPACLTIEYQVVKGSYYKTSYTISAFLPREPQTSVFQLTTGVTKWPTFQAVNKLANKFNFRRFNRTANTWAYTLTTLKDMFSKDAINRTVEVFQPFMQAQFSSSMLKV